MLALMSAKFLAMMAADGLDMDDEESMDYAADVIQADMEAYFARDRAINKGIKGFKGGKNKGKGTKHFDVSGQLSSDREGSSDFQVFEEPHNLPTMSSSWTLER